MLAIQKFIIEHKDWEEKLQQKPYCLKIRKEKSLPHLALFMYDKINSDFNEEIVREARGIIIDVESSSAIVVCEPFHKFFNYGEQYSDVNLIDWKTAKVQEKVDGSIVKLWYETKTEQWIISSNSCILAENAVLESGYNIKELFMLAIKTKGYESLDSFVADKELDTHKVYIFELVSPYNQVVVQYGGTDIYHIGTRDRITGKEIDITIANINKPKEYSISTLVDCIEAAKALNMEGKVKNEGFVVVDAEYHRIKVKSPEYVALHHAANGLSAEEIMHIVRANEVEEVLTYFPKYRTAIEEMKWAYSWYVSDVHKRTIVARTSWKKLNYDRKAYAFKWKDKFVEAFAVLDNGWDWKAYIAGLTDKQLVRKCEPYLKDIRMIKRN